MPNPVIRVAISPRPTPRELRGQHPAEAAGAPQRHPEVKCVEAPHEREESIGGSRAGVIDPSPTDAQGGRLPRDPQGVGPGDNSVALSHPALASERSLTSFAGLISPPAARSAVTSTDGSAGLPAAREDLHGTGQQLLAPRAASGGEFEARCELRQGDIPFRRGERRLGLFVGGVIPTGRTGHGTPGN